MKVPTVLLAALVVVTAAGSLIAQPPPTPIADQFLKRPVERLTSYRAWRRLEGDNSRFQKTGWLEVMTELKSDGTFEWTPLGQGGSDYVLNKVLKPVIQGEGETSAQSRNAAELNSENYAFADDLADVGGPARIRLHPRRKDKLLIDGWLVVSPENADLPEIRGRLAKGPSFWAPHVEVQRTYTRILGVRVPVLVTSQADVRLAGRFTFKMTYRYERIDGRLVKAE